MDIAHLGMESRIRYEVTIYKMRRGYEELMDWRYPRGYRDGLNMAKELSLREDITHTELVKNIEFYHSSDPETPTDTQTAKRWICRDGKMVESCNF